MNTATHTPTPWTADDGAVWYGDRPIRVLIADCSPAGGNDHAIGDAAFIVRCVNAHDDLVSIAEELAVALGALMIDKEHGECEAMHPDVADGLAQAATKRYAAFRAALAKAGAA